MSPRYCPVPDSAYASNGSFVNNSANSASDSASNAASNDVWSNAKQTIQSDNALDLFLSRIDIDST